MKKRIFLITLMVALFVCLFAISASAVDMFESDYTDEITKFYDTDGITVLAPDFANVEDTTSTAVLQKADGTYVRVPSYYIFKANSKNQFDVSGTNFDFSWVSTKLGEEETLTFANLVAFEVPHGTVSFTGVFSMSKFTTLTELVVPSTVTSFPSKFLRDNTVIKKLFVKQVKNEDGTVQGVTTIPAYFADMNTSGNVSALEFFGMELDYCTALGDRAFLNSALKSIRLEGPFTSVSSYVFCGNTSLTIAYLKNTSNTIVSCGSHAFATSTNLTSVTLHGFSIGEYAFKEIKGTQALTFVATNVGTVGTGAFSASSALVSVDISGPITKLGDNVFSNCSGLLTARIYNEAQAPASCGRQIFCELSSLTSVELHNVNIPWRGFYKLKLSPENMKVTGNYTSIGEEAFYECSNLTSFTIPDTVSSIGAKAFYKTGISTITIPGSVSSIGQRAFQFCPNLESVYFEASHENVTLSTVGDNLFGTDNGNATNTALKKVVFDENCNITKIGVYMFYNCDNLEFISMPDSVTTISAQAFYSCDNLKAVRLSTGLVDANITWSSLFVGCQNMYFVNDFITEENASNIEKPTVYYFPNVISSISSEVFKNCFRLNDVIVFGDKLTSVSNSFTFGRKNASADLGTKSIVFLGDMTELAYGGEGAYTNYYVAGANTTIASSNSGTCNVYVCKEAGAPHLVEKYGLSQDANCTENQMVYDACFCGAKLNKEEVQGTALGHDYDIMNATAIVYADYTKNGVYTTVCLRCEHDVEETVEGSHLFEYMGISASTKGTGLCAGYLLNNDYIEAYAKLNPSFEYGVVATVITGTNKSPLADDYTGKVITTALNSYTDIMAVDVIVSGNYTNVTPDDVSAYEAYSLAMSLYVKDDGISYIWDTTEDDAGTHAEVTTTTIYMEKATA